MLLIYRNWRYRYMHRFKILKVKVPIKFLGTIGFSTRREGRYRVPEPHRLILRARDDLLAVG
jgi:hypothetical protein